MASFETEHQTCNVTVENPEVRGSLPRPLEPAGPGLNPDHLAHNPCPSLCFQCFFRKELEILWGFPPPLSPILNLSRTQFRLELS